jgi:uncharacterized membrane protein YoaK (UPF0700 family)
MPLSHHGPSRSTRENLVLAFALASVAGIVNSIGFFELAVFTSNMSGNSTRLGEALATNNSALVVQTVIILASFLFGAMTATLLAERARLQHRARYVVALILEAAVLTGATLALEFLPERNIDFVHALSAALAFSMGLQNALVTHISGAVVRTTHLTGIVTDFGIEMVHLGFHIREKVRERGLRSLAKIATTLHEAPDFYKARLHMTIFLSFLAGGAIGTTLHFHVGRPAMALPVMILVALVIYDQWLQQKWRQFLATIQGTSAAPENEDAPRDPPARTGT